MGRDRNKVKRHTNTPERATMDEIIAMPALIDTYEGGSITGETPLQVAKSCAAGKYPAVKVGRGWRINKAKFLEVVGLA